MSDWRPTGRGGPSRRVFFAFLLVSVAAHATALVALSIPAIEKGPSRPAALEVVILAPKPLHLGADEPAAAPRAASGKGPTQARAKSNEPPRTPSREPVIALPEPDPDDRGTVPLANALPNSPAAEVPEREPKQAITTTANAPRFNAAYLSNPAPRYPEVARRSGEQGTVTLRVQVARDGVASRVAVEKSSGSPHLDAAALEAVKAWRFTPARRGGDTIESWMLVPIVFRLDGRS